jgi:MFS transporter, SP family, sugar:H+ symporter
VAIILMDRVNRRNMLGIGAVFMALALGVLSACFSTATGSGEDVSLGRPAGITALIAINVFAVAFGITWGPVMANCSTAACGLPQWRSARRSTG